MKKEDKELIECASKLKKYCTKSRCTSCCLRNEESGCFIFAKDKPNFVWSPQSWNIPSLKPKLTDVKKMLLRSINECYLWIAKDESDYIYVYEQKPHKEEFVWGYQGNNANLSGFKPELFDFLSWEDEEPTYIPDLLKEE